MIKLIIILLLLLVAAWIGWEIHQNPGEMMISFHNWQIETSLWMGILVVLAAFIVIYVLIRMIIRGIHLPQQWRLWRQASHQQQAQRMIELAVCELIEENWAAAEQNFQKAATEINRPLLCYLGAAIAAQAQNANQRREEYLRLAYQAAPDAELTLGILQTKLQIEGGQLADAAITLKKLQSAIPQHPVIKKCYFQIGSHDSHS